MDYVAAAVEMFLKEEIQIKQRIKDKKGSTYNETFYY